MDFLLNNIALGAFLLVVLTIFLLIVGVVKNMHIVTPNRVAVISGGKKGSGETATGYRTRRGGRFFLIPVLERVDYLSLELMVLNVEVKNAPSVDKVPVNVRAIANVKVDNNETALSKAIERFLGKTAAEIATVAKENLESNLRSIVGKMKIEDLIADRDKLMKAVLDEAVVDLGKMGLGVDLFNIQDVDDPQGYIRTLGEQRAAEVKRDAEVGKANALKDTALATAEATRMAELAKAEAAKAISDAARDRDVAMANNAVQVEQAKVQVDIRAKAAGAIAQAELNKAEVAAEMARTTAETELAELERKRNDAKLQATVIVEAERKRDAELIKADGIAKAAIRDADATRTKAEGQAAATKSLQEGEAEGRKAIALAVQAEGEAAAAIQRAKLLADAEGQKAVALAAAEGTRAKLLAEAEGMLKKAEAYKALDEGGRFLMILDASGPAIAALGEAAAKALGAVAAPVGQGLANIKDVKVVDFGGRSGGNGSGNLLSQFAAIPVETINEIVMKAAAANIDLSGLAKMAGLKIGGLTDGEAH